MTLPIDTESDGYRFYKTLNEDIQLKPDEYNRWDMQFNEGDLINVTGFESLENAICIAIMTRYKELSHNQLYTEFGCRIHELIKANKNKMTMYKVELFCVDVLEKMRRVKKVNWITVTSNPEHKAFRYLVEFSVTAIDDEIVEGGINL